ncbi:MAG: division/cell wall cluster transcriptional repressor MraZ [Anaerovoracaceae bacterium]
MFMGTYQNTLDTKNRMIVPAKFRDELGFKCVLTIGIDKCLYIYPINEWDAFVEKLSKLPTTDPKARRFARNFTGNAEECEIDRQGRMTIPQKLRDRVNITKELTTIGCMSKIEIWSREEYESVENDAQMDGNDIAEGMDVYGI